MSQALFERLYKEVVIAIKFGRSSKALEISLDELLSVAPDGSAECMFAHRHLASLRLERDPWRAALHLRKLLAVFPQDHALHAMNALAQAQLSNFQAAVNAYKKAIDLDPLNPWYQHNLGHILDVALGKSEEALKYLSFAAIHLEDEDEVLASYAHALAQTGFQIEAIEVAEKAKSISKEHDKLVHWITKGRLPEKDPIQDSDVVALLTKHMQDAGHPNDTIQLAHELWQNFQQKTGVKIVKPEAYAAAVEYILETRLGRACMSLKLLADRYDTNAQALSQTIAKMKAEL